MTGEVKNTDYFVPEAAAKGAKKISQYVRTILKVLPKVIQEGANL